MESRSNPEDLSYPLITGEYLKHYNIALKYSVVEIYSICNKAINNNTENNVIVFSNIMNNCNDITRTLLLSDLLEKIFSDKKEDEIIYVNNFLKKFVENCNNVIDNICYINILEEDMFIIKAPDSFISYAMLEFIRNLIIKYGTDTRIGISCKSDGENIIILLETESHDCNPVYSELPSDFIERHSAELNDFFSEKSGLKCEYTEKSMKISVPLYTGKLVWGLRNRKIIPAQDEFSNYNVMLSGIEKQE